MNTELYHLRAHWRSYLYSAEFRRSRQTDYVIAYAKMACWNQSEYALACAIVAASTVLTKIQFSLASALYSCKIQQVLLDIINRGVVAWDAYRAANMLGDYCDTL